MRVQLKIDLAAIAALSYFKAAQGDEAESVEINPFIALPEGGVGVDVLIQVKG